MPVGFFFPTLAVKTKQKKVHEVHFFSTSLILSGGLSTCCSCGVDTYVYLPGGQPVTTISTSTLAGLTTGYMPAIPFYVHEYHVIECGMDWLVSPTIITLCSSNFSE